MTKITRDDIFVILSNKFEPGTFVLGRPGDKMFTCVIHGTIPAKYTKINLDYPILLAIDKKETLLECEDWIEQTVKENNHWIDDDYCNKIIADVVKPEYLSIALAK